MMGGFGYIERITKDGEKLLRAHYMDRDKQTHSDYYDPDWLTELDTTIEKLNEKLNAVKGWAYSTEYDGAYLREKLRGILDG